MFSKRNFENQKQHEKLHRVNGTRVLTPENPTITLLGAAIDLGAQISGCRKAPKMIEQIFQMRGLPWNFEEIIQASESCHADNKTHSISRFCETLSSHVFKALSLDQRIGVVGGDHSCAMGTWSGAALALRPKGNLGLIWIDAHMDSHTFESSPSGAVHGMPLAALLGIGHSLFTDVGYKSAKIFPQNVCLIGVRSYEASELSLLRKLGVKIFFMDDVEEFGLSCIFERALAIVAVGTAAYGITLDLDALEPKQAPGVGSPVKRGLKHFELIQCLKSISAHRDWLGIEIAEFNPELDKDSKTAELVVEILTDSLPGRQL